MEFMRTSGVFLLFLGCLLLAACRNEPPAEPASPYDAYGAALTDEGAMPVQAVVAQRERYVGQTVKVEGTVAAVCQARGCWLTLQTTDGENVRVVVPRTEDGSDYVFTVPKDISGRRVVVEGTLAEETLSAAAHHHMAEDAGADIEADAAGPVQELQLTARGVLVEKV